MTPELENALLVQRHELEDPAEPPLAVATEQGIDYAARVQRGAALLDEKWPTWIQDIDLDTLDIFSQHHCATAQYDRHMGGGGYYRGGQYKLELSEWEYTDHGFNVEMNDEGYAPEEAYEPLTALWRDLITERRSAAQPPEASER